MIRLEQIILREIQLPLKEPFVISSGQETLRRILLVEVRDADGFTSWGECGAMDTPNYLPETVDTAWLALMTWICPRVLGKEFDGPDKVRPLLDKDIRGHNMAKASLEMAVWALEATRRDLPLSKLLGGTRNQVATGISLGLQPDTTTLVAKAKAAHDAGYRKIKLKIKPGKDVAYVQAVREALGPHGPLMVDANNAFSLDDLSLLKQLDAFDLIMIEQPLAWDDVRQHAQLQQHLQTPICLDESITSLERTRDMIALRSGRIINIKPGRVGGFSASIAIHDLCMQHGIPVWCGGMLESGIGRAHNIALASLPNFTIPGDLSPSSRYWAQDIITPAWTMNAEGMVSVPLDKPGLGVNINLDRIDNLTVRSETLAIATA